MLALAGTVVTFDPERPLVDDGVLYVGGDGRIAAVRRSRDPRPRGFSGAERIDTRGVLYPGLIDLHSHLLYNLRTLWSPPREEPYTTRDQWPNAPTYGMEITAPAKVWSKSPAAREVLAFAEVKALVGGTTAIQGAPATTKPYEGFLVRNVDNETFGTGVDPVSQSVVKLDVAGLRKRAESMQRGTAFVYHLAEGTSETLLREYDDVATAGCLRENLVAIHATALGERQFGGWTPSGSIVWSPFSNLWLYRATTDVVAARDAGVRVCLGSDWGPSGSKNVLGELKVADLWNRERLDGALSDAELCAMVTTNPAEALGPLWRDNVGRLAPGRLADVLVLDARRADVHRNLIDGTEASVRLVLVGGRARYGEAGLMTAAGAEAAEPIRQAGPGRTVSLADSREPMTWRGIRRSLEAVRKDPKAAVEWNARARDRGEEPFELIPDMPEGPAPRAIDWAQVVMPPLDSLRHDAAFFRALGRRRAPILDGLLDGLRAYYDGSR